MSVDRGVVELSGNDNSGQRMINFTFYFEIFATHIRSYNTSGCLDIAFIDTNKKIVKSKIKRNIVKTDNIKLKKK